MRILIVAGGPVRKLDLFVNAAKNLNIDLTVASFSDINFRSGNEYSLFVGNQDLSSFDVIYFRVVGKRVEDATLVANYAKAHKIPVFDDVYQDSLLLPSSISKALEIAKLVEAGVPMPKTIFGSLKYLSEVAPKTLGFPFVIKSTSGKKAREVWAPQNNEELEYLLVELRQKEKEGIKYFAQEFVKASMRLRAFVIGDEVVTVLAQPTKWRKRFNSSAIQKGPIELTQDLKSLALASAKAVNLDISGVDILKQDNTGELLVIEANAAPSWNLVRKYTGMNVEEEILRWLIKQI